MHRPWLTLRRAALAFAFGASLAGGFVSAATAQSAFPFGREFMLDTEPMKGSKRIPSMDVDDKGVADITLWCSSVKSQLVVAGDTVTIITGPKTEGSCPSERMQADDDLLAALTGVTNWKLEGDTLVLTGVRTMRFRPESN